MSRKRRGPPRFFPAMQVRESLPPMLITRGLINDKYELEERALIRAFELGFATTAHFDMLADMQGILLLAGSTSQERAPAMRYATGVLGPVLLSIRQRYDRTKKFDCASDELKVLREFVSMNRDFWLKQPTELYNAAVESLNAHNAKLAAQRKGANHA